MKTNALRRWLALLLTGGVFAVIVVVAVANRNGKVEGDDPKKEGATGDWPLFGGTLQRNFVNTREKGIPEKWEIDDKQVVKWSANLGSKGYGGPIVAGGKVYVGTNNANPRDPAIKGDKGVLMCFDEKTGKFLWQITHDKLPDGRVKDWPEEGICSSPFVEGNKLYYVSNRCEVVCADVNGDPANAGKGKVLWAFDMIKELNVFPHNLAVCSPLIVGDHIYVVTANGVDEGHINIPAPKAPSFLCLNKTTGKAVWHKNNPSVRLVEATEAGKAVDVEKLKNQGLILMHGQWSNPVYAEAKGQAMVIFPGGDGWIYAFEPAKGELLWKFDCNPKDAFYVLGPRATRNDFIGTPVVYEDKLYIAVGQDPEHKEGVGHLWCIDITKKPANKDKDLSPQDTKFDPKDPKNKDSGLVWHYGGAVPKDVDYDRNYYFGRSMSTCAVHDGMVYAADLNGYVYCFDARTGKKHWEHDTGGAIWASPYWVDGKVFLGNDLGTMFVFAHGTEKKKLAEIDMGGKVRATPIAANGNLYCLTESQTKLYCIGKK